MTRALQHRLRHSLVAGVALLIGCADGAPLGPGREPDASVQLAAASQGNGNREVSLGACQNLRPPADSKLAFHVYASGVQIYRWNGASWSFAGPSAVLSADAGGNSTIGIHYGGPTWESVSGSLVRGAVVDRCTPDASTIPWLLLRATSSTGPGIFHRVTFIQRVNTTGGKEPSAPGSFVGEEARVPYTAEYFFYR